MGLERKEDRKRVGNGISIHSPDSTWPSNCVEMFRHFRRVLLCIIVMMGFIHPKPAIHCHHRILPSFDDCIIL